MNEAAQKPAALDIRDLHVKLGGIEILSGVSATIKKGEITAIIGPNGAGKTTLLLAILGMVPYTGEIVVRRKNGEQRIGYVPQHLDFDRGMPATVADFLAMGMQRLPVWIGQRKSIKSVTRQSLEQVEAAHLFDRKLGNLSGGELQRVLLAKALLTDPEVVMLDEPSSAVDKTGEELFMRLIRELHRDKGLTLLMVSHDLTMVTRLAHQVICLNRTVFSEGKTADVINEENLSACFGPDKGILLHNHGWDGELSCAYEDPAHKHEGEG